MKNLISSLFCLVVLLAISGCSGTGPISQLIEDAQTAEAQPNEYLKICASAVADTPLVDGEATIVNTKFPDTFDTSVLTAEQFMEATTCQ